MIRFSFRRGVSLVELLVVVAILAILLALSMQAVMSTNRPGLTSRYRGKLAVVHGRIKFNGRAPHHAKIVFIPKDTRHNGAKSFGQADANGYYRLQFNENSDRIRLDERGEGAVLGKHQVCILIERLERGRRVRSIVGPIPQQVASGVNEINFEVTPEMLDQSPVCDERETFSRSS